jgi:hypothetical protein
MVIRPVPNTSEAAGDSLTAFPVKAGEEPKTSFPFFFGFSFV